LLGFLLTCLAVGFEFTPIHASPTSGKTSPYFKLGLEATDWITSFQVTPLSSRWGIPYPDASVWGLDPYYYSNGTITAATNGINGGARQQLAYLLGGHDAGLGASAALDAYLSTQDPRYLAIFNTYYGYFQRSQIPSPTIAATTVTRVAGKNVTIDNAGFFAEQASVSTGPDGIYGTSDDNAKLESVYSAAEHGNPIAAALIAYYRLTGNETALRMLNRYGNWLVRIQIREGNFTGAFPVTQYYLAHGWKPRMFETTESAWILSELYSLTGNKTYLNAAVAAGRYMLSRQFSDFSDPHVRGALPYEWNETRYTTLVLTNHAGFTLLAWTQLYRITGESEFVDAAKKYANWLLSFQVTTPDTPWGDHTYANDSMAIGGFYYGYDTQRHEFGWRVALSLWSAAYAIPGLLLVAQYTNSSTYRHSAQLAADWLTKMRYADESPAPLQSLAIIKYVLSSWWGLYPQFYQPDMREVRKAGIPEFIASVRADPSVLVNRDPTWFEGTFNVNFNAIDYQMASRGDQYMKMIWSWWPDLGFEPRYGGDIASGAYTIANYLVYENELTIAQSDISEIEALTNNSTLGSSANVTTSYLSARVLMGRAMRDFSDGWYVIAAAELGNATRLAEYALNELVVLIPANNLKARVQIETAALLVLVVFAAITNAYWYRKVRRLSSKRNRRKIS